MKLVSEAEADTSPHTQGLMAPSPHLPEACWAGLLFLIIGEETETDREGLSQGWVLSESVVEL